MATLDRDVVRVAGVRFLEEDGQILFEHTIDALNVIGPRPVKAADKEQFAGEWARFVAGQPLSQLDHDLDGRPGGSVRLQQFELAARQAERAAEAVVDVPTHNLPEGSNPSEHSETVSGRGQHRRASPAVAGTRKRGRPRTRREP